MSRRRARVVLWPMLWVVPSSRAAGSSSSKSGSISVSSLSGGRIKGQTTVITARVSNANKPLRKVNTVSVMGMTPISASRECPGVATNRPAEEE